MEFIERIPLEKGFAQVFQLSVRPALLDIETQRLARFSKARLWMGVSAAAAIALAVLIVLIFGPEEGAFIAVLFVLVGGAGGVWGVWAAQNLRWGESVAEAIMPAICEHVGNLNYDKDAKEQFPLARMQALGLLGQYNDARLSDRLDGSHRGTRFELVEARLTHKTRDSKGKSRTKRVFSGLLFHIEVPVAISAPILIARDRGGIGNSLSEMFSGSQGRGMAKVDFSHKRFERAFEVYSNDPQAARSMMPPAFLDNLLAIGEAEGGKRGAKSMVAGFEDKSFFLALARGGDFLKMGSLRTPVAKMEEDIHAIFSDIDLINRIIVRLHGD